MKLLCILLVLIVLLGCTEESAGMLPNGNEIKSELVNLRAEKKFVENLKELYPGAPNEQTRIAAEILINSTIDELINYSDKELTEDKFWGILKQSATQLSMMDSEEMDQGLWYMERLMDIYKIESSNGRLNEWRYGIDSSSL